MFPTEGKSDGGGKKGHGYPVVAGAKLTRAGIDRRTGAGAQERMRTGDPGANDAGVREALGHFDLGKADEDPADAKRLFCY